METIIINVDADTATKWSDISIEMKQKLNLIFQKQIAVFYKEKNKKKLFELMDRVGAEAEKRGLTEEILQEILNEEE